MKIKTTNKKVLKRVRKELKDCCINQVVEIRQSPRFHPKAN